MVYERTKFSNPMSEPYRKAALFASLWEKEYGEKFIINGMMCKWAKELVDVQDDTIVSRFRVYIREEFYQGCRHSLPAFVKNFNSFVPKVKARREKACTNCGEIGHSYIFCTVVKEEVK